MGEQERVRHSICRLPAQHQRRVQFLAFQRGFDLVTSESPIHMMFTPQELEMLICGEKEFDFNELESSTEYDGGFSRQTPCVAWFWEAVHSMALEDKRKLLQFTTGSDRIQWEVWQS